ncbi:MAG: hypothetical protein JEZ08_24665 [Clostridiales bacterium]|nr:hypothetical protein [Clostridiales bacterium]
MKRKIVISEKAHQETFDYFVSKGFEIIKFKDQLKPYKAVSHHPDMFMFYDDKLFVEKNIPLDGIRCGSLGEKYPETVKFNLAKIGEFVVCKYDVVSETIKEHLRQKNYKIINVNQGYSKCSTAIVGNAFITSDKGIYDACIKEGITGLLIRPGSIELPDLDYGFIGGTCVSFDDVVYFNGNITKHPDYESIKSFITKTGKKIDYINIPLTDVGSFIIIERSE